VTRPHLPCTLGLGQLDIGADLTREHVDRLCVALELGEVIARQIAAAQGKGVEGADGLSSRRPQGIQQRGPDHAVAVKDGERREVGLLGEEAFEGGGADERQLLEVERTEVVLRQRDAAGHAAVINAHLSLDRDVVKYVGVCPRHAAPPWRDARKLVDVDEKEGLHPLGRRAVNRRRDKPGSRGRGG
jgi:hypothetical protein